MTTYGTVFILKFTLFLIIFVATYLLLGNVCNIHRTNLLSLGPMTHVTHDYTMRWTDCSAAFYTAERSLLVMFPIA